MKDSIKEGFSEVVDDAKEIKLTFESDKQSARKKSQSFVSRHKWKLIFIGIAIFAITTSNAFTIPSFLYVLVVSFIIGAIVTYPYARYVAKMFIEDNRIPVVDSDPKNLNEFSAWLVSKEDFENMKVEGDLELNKIQTNKGIGYEGREIRWEENGDTKRLVGKGVWAGSKSGLEIRRKEEEIENMYENLEPKARKAMEYEIKWPTIIDEITGVVINAVVHDFNSEVNYKGEKINEHIQSMVKNLKPHQPKDMKEEELKEENAEVDEKAVKEAIAKSLDND